MGRPYYDLLEAVCADKLEEVVTNLAREKFTADQLGYVCSRSHSFKTKEVLLSQTNSEEDKKALFFALIKYHESDFAISLLKNKWVVLNEAEKIEFLFEVKENGSFEFVQYCVLENAFGIARENKFGKTILNGLGGPYGLQDDEGSYGLRDRGNNEGAKIDIFLIQRGALKNLKNVSVAEKEIRKFVESKKNPTSFVQELCRVIIDYIDIDQTETLSLDLKRLAIACALVLKDNTLLEKFTKKSSAEEHQWIDRFLQSLVHPPVSREIEGIRNIYHKDAQFNRVYLSIAELLQDTALCIDILGGLEARLAERYRVAGIDVSQYHQQSESFVFFNLPWPVLKNIGLHTKTHHFLNAILLEKERKHGINEDPDAPVFFSGFVPENIAGQYVKEANIFSEYNYIGNLLHGKYSHRLQWYIILTAIEKDLLKTNNLSAKQLLCESTEVWTHLFDRYQELRADNRSVGFRSPALLHSSLLLLKNELPHLSGTLRKIFSRSVQIVSARQEQETPYIRICAEYDIRESAFINIYDDIPCDKYFESRQADTRVVYQGEKSTFVFFRNRSIQKQKFDTFVCTDQIGLK
jgi:hypothetical protein